MIMQNEWELVEFLEFDFCVHSPQYYLLKYQGYNSAKFLELTWKLVNDFEYTWACLFYHPMHIALTCIYMGSVVVHDDQYAVEQQYFANDWWDEMNITRDEIEPIAKLLLRFYSVVNQSSTGTESSR